MLDLRWVSRARAFVLSSTLVPQLNIEVYRSQSALVVLAISSVSISRRASCIAENICRWSLNRYLSMTWETSATCVQSGKLFKIEYPFPFNSVPSLKTNAASNRTLRVARGCGPCPLCDHYKTTCENVVTLTEMLKSWREAGKGMERPHGYATPVEAYVGDVQTGTWSHPAETVERAESSEWRSACSIPCIIGRRCLIQNVSCRVLSSRCSDTGYKIPFSASSKSGVVGNIVTSETVPPWSEKVCISRCNG